jgi:hypothetical protein
MRKPYFYLWKTGPVSPLPGMGGGGRLFWTAREDPDRQNKMNSKKI